MAVEFLSYSIGNERSGVTTPVVRISHPEYKMVCEIQDTIYRIIEPDFPLIWRGPGSNIVNCKIEVTEMPNLEVMALIQMEYRRLQRIYG